MNTSIITNSNILLNPQIIQIIFAQGGEITWRERPPGGRDLLEGETSFGETSLGETSKRERPPWARPSWRARPQTVVRLATFLTTRPSTKLPIHFVSYITLQVVCIAFSDLEWKVLDGQSFVDDLRQASCFSFELVLKALGRQSQVDKISRGYSRGWTWPEFIAQVVLARRLVATAIGYSRSCRSCPCPQGCLMIFLQQIVFSPRGIAFRILICKVNFP